MNENSDSKNNSVPWSTKAKYIGAGIVVGALISPFIKKAITKVQPKIDELFDHLTGKTEEFAERTADLLAKAKEQIHRADEPQRHSHHSHEAHSHETHSKESQATSMGNGASVDEQA